MGNELLDIVKGTPNILSQVYNDLAQPSVKAVGSALGTVFEFSTSFLLPVKLLNEKFKLNFTKRLNEYKDKLEQIPEDKRCEVHPQVGTPIIDKLSYTTNDEIADMFTTLLANASNIDMINTAHPSFVSIIERLSPDEAKIIRYLKGKDEILYCDFIGQVKDGEGVIIFCEHLTLIPKETNIFFEANMNAYLANLVSLGILADIDRSEILGQDDYDKIKELYGFNKYKEQMVPKLYKHIFAYNSYYKITSARRNF